LYANCGKVHHSIAGAWLKSPWSAQKLAHVARCDCARAKHLLTARQRVLRAGCSEVRLPLPSIGLKSPLVA
jgi:hypothetical protein